MTSDNKLFEVEEEPNGVHVGRNCDRQDRCFSKEQFIALAMAPTLCESTRNVLPEARLADASQPDEGIIASMFGFCGAGIVSGKRVLLHIEQIEEIALNRFRLHLRDFSSKCIGLMCERDDFNNLFNLACQGALHAECFLIVSAFQVEVIKSKTFLFVLDGTVEEYNDSTGYEACPFADESISEC